MTMTLRTWFILGSAILYSLANAQTYPDVPIHAQDFKTDAVFKLMVHKSSVLKLGSSAITTLSAFATVMTKGTIGYSEGIEIQFFTKPITEENKTDLLQNGAKELRKGDHAVLVLFLDNKQNVAQANLTYVIPGTTVTRTMAWKPEDLKRYFSIFKFDGKRLMLKSEGSYSDADSEQEKLTLSWKMDVDLPVFNEITK